MQSGPTESVTGGKQRMFYGWWIVLSSAMIGFFVGGTFFYGFTIFVDPVINEFQWTYRAISVAIALRGIEAGIAAPIVGYLTDRIGPRRLIFAGALVAGVGFILLSYTNSLAMFYVSFILISSGFSACDILVLTTAIANWFRKRVSRAMGLSIIGFGLGGLLLPVLDLLLVSYGWRTTFVILGISTFICIGSLSFVFRHKPEQYGLLPDGDIKPVIPDSSVLSTEEQTMHKGVEKGLRQSLKTINLWSLTIVTTILFMGFGAVVLYVVPYLSDVGYPEATAARYAMAIPLSSVVGRIGFGWLGDYFNKKRVLTLTYVFLTAGLLLFASAHYAWALILSILMFGLGLGGAMAVRPAIQREYFGRKSFGSILGFMFLIATLGDIAGPVIAAQIFDVFKSFRPAWYLFAATMAACIPLILIMKSQIKQDMQ